MKMSFYVGAVGARQSLDRLSVISNNLSNINNTGFKPKNAVFSELINYNLNDSPDAVTELQAGAGAKLVRTNTDFSASGVTQTGSPEDYAIMEPNAFFMLRDPADGSITYTRDGDFHGGELEGTIYLTAANGKQVLDENGDPIVLVENIEDGEEEDDDEDEEEIGIGVYTFENPSRLISIGNNEYIPADDTMEPILVEDPELAQGALESSGTDVAKEMANLIETQRAFSYAVKMITTSDEVTQTINSLRG